MIRFTKIPRLLLLDESGFIISTELVLIATILILGTITGLCTVRDAVVHELGDLSSAVKTIDQSYSFGDSMAHSARTSGSEFGDRADFCTPGFSDDFPPEQIPVIVIGGNPSGGESG